MAEETKKKKVVILGTASNTVDDAPLEDASFEFFALAWRKDLKKFTRLFDIHPFTDERFSKRKVPARYIDHLSSLACPIYLQKKHPKIPNSVEYPLNEVIRKFGPELDPYANGAYFSSSVCYMIYFALLEEFEEIHFYGVDLVEGSEYSYQRPNTEYCIGLARGLGVKVFIPEKSALCKFSYIYGYEKEPDIGFLNMDVLTERRKQYQDKQDMAMKAWYAADGARQETQQLISLLGQHQKGFIKEQEEDKAEEVRPPIEG